MNPRQRGVLFAAAGCILVMLLFPPTAVVYEDAVTYGGFRPLWSLHGVLMVASGPLAVQILGNTCAALLVCRALRDK